MMFVFNVWNQILEGVKIMPYLYLLDPSNKVLQLQNNIITLNFQKESFYFLKDKMVTKYAFPMTQNYLYLVVEATNCTDLPSPYIIIL